MSHTEQMREALEKIAAWNAHDPMLGVNRGSNGVRDFYRQIAQTALTAPAAKCATCNGHGLVGGHMQDGSGYGEGCPDCNPEPAPAAEVPEQSTRLRGGVPDDESEHDVMMGMAADDQVRIETLTIHLRSVIEIARTWQPDYATKMDRDMLDLAEAALPALGSTAAPQAPALDAGVVGWIETITGRVCAPDDEHRLKFPMCYEPLVRGEPMTKAEPEPCATCDSLRKDFARECGDTDTLLRLLGLQPDEVRTDGGSLNLPRLAILIEQTKSQGEK